MTTNYLNVKQNLSLLSLSIWLLHYLRVWINICEWMPHVCWYPRAGVTCSCEPPGMSAGNLVDLLEEQPVLVTVSVSCLCCTSWNKQMFSFLPHRMDSLKFCTCFGVQLPRHLLLTFMQQQTVSLPSFWIHFKCLVALKFDVKLLLYCFIKQFF